MDDSRALTELATAALAVVAATPVSLNVPDDLPYADWERLGAELKTLGTWTPWSLGDWYNAGERLYGEEAAQAVSDLGLEVHTLQNYAWICRRFPPEQRRPELTISHHAETAALGNAAEWLDLAVQEGWDRATLRNAIREARREQVAEAQQHVVTLPPAVTARGVVEVNGGLAYVGLAALGDLLATLEGFECEITCTPVAPAEEE